MIKIYTNEGIKEFGTITTAQEWIVSTNSMVQDTTNGRTVAEVALGGVYVAVQRAKAA